MDSVKRKLLMAHLDKVINKVGFEKVSGFINRHLEEEEKYIPLKDYAAVFAEDGERVVPAEGEYPNRYDLDKNAPVFPLPLKVEDDCNGLEHGENYIRSTELVNISELQGTGGDRRISAAYSYVLTKDNEVVFIKCLMHPRKIVYQTLSLASIFGRRGEGKYGDEKPFDRSAIYFAALGELLPSITDESKVEEIYHIRDVLFENALRHIVDYSVGGYDELHYIREGLKLKNSKHGEVTVREGEIKNEIVIGVGGEEISVGYYESEITPSSKGSKTYRSKNGPTRKWDIENIIIRAKEPGRRGKSHYIFVSGFKSLKSERIHLHVPFRRDENGGFVLNREPENRYVTTGLIFTPISEIDLLNLPQREIKVRESVIKRGV